MGTWTKTPRGKCPLSLVPGGPGKNLKFSEVIEIIGLKGKQGSGT
jgi:hypothetical protein